MSGAGYSCNDNQNYFVADGKTTSRVLSEPGGKSSICLGWEDGSSSNSAAHKKASTEEPNQTEKEEAETADPNKKENEEEENEEEEKKQPAAAGSSSEWGSMTFGQEENVSGNKFASGSNMNSGNVITGRPSSRVLNPPGGKTSISLG